MILQCPNCNARFAVPDSAIPPEGRTVKCGKCAHQWFATRIGEDARADIEAIITPAPAVTPDFAAMAEQAYQETPTMPAGQAPAVQVPAKPPLRIPLLPFKIAAPVLALAWLGIALFAYFPALQNSTVFGGIYGMLGVTDTRDLTFADVTMDREMAGTRTKFLLSGSIANHGAAPRLLPQVRVALKNAQGKVIWSQNYAVNEVIKPGQVYPFLIDNVETSFAKSATSIVMDIGNNFELMMR